MYGDVGQISENRYGVNTAVCPDLLSGIGFEG